MPEEILIIVIFSIAAGTLLSLVRMFLGYQERKCGAVGRQGSSMTIHELEAMMRRAVPQATSSLEKKIENLEFEVATRKTPRELKRARTDFLLDPDDDVEEREGVRQTTRTRS